MSVMRSVFILPLLSYFLVLKEFNIEVSYHSKTEEDDGEDELGEDTNTTCLGDESNNKSHGFPKSVVGECSFFIRCKENSIEGIDLSLPDGITNTPESSKHIHN